MLHDMLGIAARLRPVLVLEGTRQNDLHFGKIGMRRQTLFKREDRKPLPSSGGSFFAFAEKKESRYSPAGELQHRAASRTGEEQIPFMDRSRSLGADGADQFRHPRPLSPWRRRVGIEGLQDLKGLCGVSDLERDHRFGLAR